MRQRIAIFLRRSASINRFRNILVGCVNEGCVNEAVISSGFFQEDNKFSGSALFALTPSRCGRPIDLIFVGVHNSRWVAQFNFFVTTIQRANCLGCVSISKRKPRGLRWHAKTFIGSIGGEPRIGIIGSSNLTRPAADTSKPFNYEADVVLWYESDNAIDKIVSQQIESKDGSHEVIVTTYEEGGLNGPLSLGDRLRSLRDEILNNSYEF